tara:strand:- start:642 stop:1061 length:420 start_codon:yes stop_codon:yes gene_type:complete
MNTEIRLLKLTNGEDIIAEVDENTEKYNLDNPLLMKVHTRVTSSGVQEGLHLSRWLQPFCEYSNFAINKSHVLLSTNVSEGLSKYYEYTVKSFKREEAPLSLRESILHEGPTDDELDQIEEEEFEAELEALEPFNKTIH